MKNLFIVLVLLISSACYAMLVANFPIVTNGNMNTSIYSSPVQITQDWGVSIQAAFSGAPVGTLNIQICNDVGVIHPDGTVTGLVNWSDYTGSSAAVSGAGNQSFDVWAVAAKWVRLVYTFGSGTGALNARANLKGN